GEDLLAGGEGGRAAELDERAVAHLVGDHAVGRRLVGAEPSEARAARGLGGRGADDAVALVERELVADVAGHGARAEVLRAGFVEGEGVEGGVAPRSRPGREPELVAEE